ncbi:MAG: alpha/beta fold hydrolase [Neomegalonema sp.]|nr:alpha/beta fold hydrolase [Neomegalonema sp.]
MSMGGDGPGSGAPWDLLEGKTMQLNFDRYDSPAQGVPLIIAHGLFGSARNFASLAKGFAEHRPVLCVDMRNHGASPWSEVMDYEAMGRDLLDLIADEAGGRALVLGHSMGGKAAMSASLQAPQAVAGLFVADIAPVQYAHSPAPFIGALKALDLSAISRRSQADPMLAEAIPEAPLRAFILQNLVIEDGQARWRVNLDVIDAQMSDLTGWPEALDALRHEAPVTFYHGGASPYVTESGKARIKARFPAAQIDEMPGAGHWLHAENPALFARRVSQWLEGTGE